MVIIAIILSFVLVAGMDAARRAEERATQSLIAKLEAGLNDRLETLLQVRPDYNSAHFAIGSVFNKAYGQLTSIPRAQIVAWCDFIKSELPDVFFIQNDANYPINFAGNPFPGNAVASTGFSALDKEAQNILPIGNTMLQQPNSGGVYSSSGTGIYGASYAIAAGIYKNLGYLPAGYDGIDNDGNGLIDDSKEGLGNPPNFTPVPAVQAQVQAHLGNHKHVTARAEMLYAILVEGSGPYGSVFSRDEFTDKEVQDTDGDGLPEFVDAWGQPLQFFRWPLLYHSDLQRGQAIVASPTAATQTWALNSPYLNVFQEREQDPLDTNRLLMAPAWWSSTGVSTVKGTSTGNDNFTLVAAPSYAATVGSSGGVQAFEYFFHRLTEPLPTPNAATGLFWDRGGFPYRRAFYSKFLILSGGQDQIPGVFLYAETDMQGMGSGAAPFLIFNENNALPFAMDLFGGGTAGFTTNGSITNTSFVYGPSNDPLHPSSYDLLQAGQDDISNHYLQATGGIGGS
jgi:hypothetical protein